MRLHEYSIAFSVRFSCNELNHYIKTHTKGGHELLHFIPQSELRGIKGNLTEYPGVLGIGDGKEFVLLCPLSQVWSRGLPNILRGGLLLTRNIVSLVPPNVATIAIVTVVVGVAGIASRIISSKASHSIKNGQYDLWRDLPLWEQPPCT